jgi:hypothetical protein
MIRFGATSENASEMDLDRIFISRLELLIVMARAYLEGYPLGAVRKSAMIGNANYITAESVDLELLIPTRGKQPCKDGMNFDHLFYQRVKLLASMVRTIGENDALGAQQKKTLTDNLEIICNALQFTSGVKKVDFLKVA